MEEHDAQTSESLMRDAETARYVSLLMESRHRMGRDERAHAVGRIRTQVAVTEVNPRLLRCGLFIRDVFVVVSLSLLWLFLGGLLMMHFPEQWGSDGAELPIFPEQLLRMIAFGSDTSDRSAWRHLPVGQAWQYEQLRDVIGFLRDQDSSREFQYYEWGGAQTPVIPLRHVTRFSVNEVLLDFAVQYFAASAHSPERKAILQRASDEMTRIDGLHWTTSNVRQWFANHQTHTGGRQRVPGRSLGQARMGEASRRMLRESNARVAGLQALLDIANASSARLAEELASRDEDMLLFEEELNWSGHSAAVAIARCEEAERLLAEMQERVADLEMITGEQQAFIEDLLSRIENGGEIWTLVSAHAAANEGFNFLAELNDLSRIGSPNRRRYSEQFYELCFILHRYSGTAYDLLRTWLPLPDRRQLQRHFSARMHGRIADLTDMNILRDYVVRSRSKRGIPSQGQLVALAIDATGISDNGADGGAGYAFAFGLMFLDPRFADLWMHVESAATGAFREVADLTTEILRILASIGLQVLFVATDGDPGTDRFHTEAFAMYEGVGSLRELFELWHENRDILVHPWPVSDLLHLLKNQRQRLRNGHLAAHPGDEGFTGADISEVLGGLSSIAVPGTRHAQSDADARRTFRLEIAIAAFELDDRGSGAFFAPWALLNVAIVVDDLSFDARMQALEVAFRMFMTQYTLLPEARGSDLRQRAARGTHLTFADANHLRRAMNDCVAIFIAMMLGGVTVALGRIGTHPVEGHFGIARAALRGLSQWRSWVSAEAFASLVPEMREFLGVGRAPPRRSRLAQTGAHTHADRPGDVAAFQPERILELLDSAAAFVRGDRADLVLEYMATLLAQVDLDEPAAPGIWMGHGAQTRQILR
jgi:uncharacterized protein YjeT (DUF2065 family)